MIDVSKCKYEESFIHDGYTVHYFILPKEELEKYGDFYGEEDYGNVVFACLSLTFNENDDYYVQLSPTIEEDDGYSDVDWRDLYDGIHYNDDTIIQLLKKAELSD